jgi:hypothetical protein
MRRIVTAGNSARDSPSHHAGAKVKNDKPNESHNNSLAHERFPHS